jgi:hypothetical protein
MHVAHTLTTKFRKDDTPGRVVVFRCRDGDDCGGIGDIFDGMTGAAMLAAALGRNLKIDWPYVEYVFDRGEVDWLYKADAFNVSKKDQRILEKRVTNTRGRVAFPDPSFTGLSPDIAVMNMLNTKTFAYWHEANFATYQQYRVIYFHGNRGLNPAWFGTSSWAKDSLPLQRVYGCIFNSLFVPRVDFMQRVVRLSDSEKWTMEEIARFLKKDNVFSVAVHIRLSTKSELQKSKGQPVKGEHYLKDMKWVSCVNKVLKEASAGRHNVFIAITSSRNATTKIVNHIAKSSLFSNIWGPLKEGEPHIIRKEFANKQSSPILSLQEAFMDWLLLSYADVLLFDHSSRFPLSAAYFAGQDQTLLSVADYNLCQPLKFVGYR